MKHAALVVPLLLVSSAAFADEASVPSQPSVTKADCDAALGAEVKRLEEGFSRTRIAWEQSVEQRFSDHDKELTSAQMHIAHETFNHLVLKLSDVHVKAVALPGIYRMMLTIPQYDIAVCSKPREMRALGDQAIAGFLLQLTQLLPLVETSVSAAKIDG